MLFCIAALGSTWGAYALWFERLVGGSDRTEMGHAHANTACIDALTLPRDRLS